MHYCPDCGRNCDCLGTGINEPSEASECECNCLLDDIIDVDEMDGDNARDTWLAQRGEDD